MVVVGPVQLLGLASERLAEGIVHHVISGWVMGDSLEYQGLDSGLVGWGEEALRGYRRGLGIGGRGPMGRMIAIVVLSFPCGLGRGCLAPFCVREGLRGLGSGCVRLLGAYIRCFRLIGRDFGNSFCIAMLCVRNHTSNF
jgi:hypothetical protein